MKRYYELVQVALGSREKLTQTPLEKDWTHFFVLSQKQAVAGVVFTALDKLSNIGQKPPLNLLFEWIGLSEQIKAQNEILNSRSREITSLFAEAGFRSCILKGQGNALMYPNPLTRTPGDIDIWVEGERSTIKNFVLSRCPNAKDGPLHITFPIYKDVEIEVHYIPRKTSIPRYNTRLQRWISERADKQFSNNVLLNERYISVPTLTFNTVFQMSHIMGHFFVEGIGLKQFVDYYFLLKKLHCEGCEKNFEELFNYLGMLKFAHGVMWIEKEVLGLEPECLIVCEDEKIGRIILKEIEEGGNFGQHDERYTIRRKGVIGRGVADLYRLLKLFWYFPENVIWKVIRKAENQKWRIK